MTLLLFLPLGGCLAILAGPFLVAWVGPAYEEQAVLVAVLLLAGLFDTAQWPAAAILQGIAHHRPVAFMSAGSAVANLLLSLALVHPFGLLGVALGTLIPTTIECTVFLMPYALRTLRLRFSDLFLRVLVPTILPILPAMLAVAAVRAVLTPSGILPLAFTGALGVGVYGLVYLLCGATAAERRVVRMGLTRTWWNGMLKRGWL
jgi:O-antigen/teichoic acid export membrane protein